MRGEKYAKFLKEHEKQKKERSKKRRGWFFTKSE
jgi:hypothetical protein